MGLTAICTSGGEIYAARKRVKWPGLAAVVVSVVHVVKGRFAGQRLLDDRPVPIITAFLFHGGGHTEPAALAANAGQSFVGSYVLGMGFTFDDTTDEATPIAELHRLIAKDPRNAERIFPYIGGQEVNTSPTHAHHRYVINFSDMSEEQAQRWPDLMAIAEAKVKPERLRNNREGYRRYWWQYGEKRVDLYAAIAGLDRVLVAPRTSKYIGFAHLPTGMVYSENTVVFPLSGSDAFCILQSQVHDLWVRFFTSTLEDRIGYRPSDCFETFPFPPDWTTDPALEAAGEAYYTFRAALMVKNDEGLTKTYNRFHDPDERDPDILRLRELHAAMDRAVLAAYGWADLPTACEFLLDYEIDEETWGSKKKPYRYRWPEAVHDEVLARLLALNQARHEAEQAAGLHAKGAGKKQGRKAAKKATPANKPTAPPARPTPKPGPRTLDLFAPRPNAEDDG